MSWYRSVFFLLCLLSILFASSSFQSNKKDNKHSIIVLVGATGDLASKYLWQALFNVYNKALDDVSGIDKNGAGRFANQSFSFFGAARKSEEQGMIIVNNILARLECPTTRSKDEKTPEECAKHLEDFSKNVIYVKLSDDQDFEKLCVQTLMKFSNVEDSTKELLIYLSISPSVYESVIRRFRKACGAYLKDQHVELKWSLEKPFGRDKQSAEALSDKVLQYAEEKQIYRVDHYLGKPLSKTVLPFRYANPDLEQLINKENVDRVEVFLKETIGVEGAVSVADIGDLGFLPFPVI